MSQPLKLLPKGEDSERGEVERASALAELFQRAQRGDIPRDRILHPWEPDKLNERHCLAVMMRCSGMRQTDIAKALDYTNSTVSIILNHPDSLYIISQLQGFSGVNVTDIDARLKRLTPRAVDAIEAVFDEEVADDPKAINARVQRARLGFDLLAHTGHGKKSEIRHNHQHSISPAAASLLSRALRESREIPDVTYSEIAPGNGVEEVSPPPAALPLGTGAPPSGGSQELN